MGLLLVAAALAAAATCTKAFVLPVGRQCGQPTPIARSQSAWLAPVRPPPSSIHPLQSTASGAAEPATGSSNSETVLWLRGLSNTFDGQRFQFKDVSLSLAKGASARSNGRLTD